jgi:hypothetical protein
MMRSWFAPLAFALIAAPQPSRAEGRAVPVPCEERHPSALGQVACEIARGLPASTTPLLVAASPVSSDLRAERTDELARALASLVSGEVGPRARTSERLLDAASAQRGAPRGVDVLVLGARLGRERFAVSAQLIPAPRGFWERFRPGLLGATVHLEASRAPDAELKAHLPPVPLVLTRIDKASALDEPAVAVSCGDVDGDGALEIVHVGRRQIKLGRLLAGAFQVTASAAWSELSAIAARPLREPIASARLLPSGLEVGISDRADAVRLDRALRVLARFPARLPWPAGGCASVVVNGLSGERSPCTSPAVARDPANGVDAIAGARLVRRDGSALTVFAARRLDGQLELELGPRRITVAGPVGAQLAVGDLDGDGRPELLTSVDTLDPARDALLVRTLSDDGSLRDAFRVPVPSGVRGVGVCPSEGNLLTPIVLATGDGVWVLR